MPLFGRKKVQSGEDWSLGKSAVKQAQKERRNDLVWEKPKESVPSNIVEMPATEVLPHDNVQNCTENTSDTVDSSKSFAVELDGSTISSLPPSHRDGGSVSGSEPARVPSTRATSMTTNSPIDRLTQEILVPDAGEKEVHATSIPLASPSLSDTPDLSAVGMNKEVYVPSRPESSIFSLPVTPGSLSKAFREYRFYNTPNFKDLVICDPTQKAMFFAEVSSHTRSKADVGLRDIRETLNIPASKSMSLNEKDIAKTPIVATADFVPDENANQVRIGIGDPLDPAACAWIAMNNVARDTVTGVERFDMSVPGSDGNPLVFSWIRNATSDSEPSNDATDAKEAYRLVCGDQIIASFRNTSMTNCISNVGNVSKKTLQKDQTNIPGTFLDVTMYLILRTYFPGSRQPHTWSTIREYSLDIGVHLDTGMFRDTMMHLKSGKPNIEKFQIPLFELASTQPGDQYSSLGRSCFGCRFFSTWRNRSQRS